MPRNVAAKIGSRYDCETVASNPPVAAAERTPPTPAMRPAVVNDPKRSRFTRTPASRETSRFAPTKRMFRPSGVNHMT